MNNIFKNKKAREKFVDQDVKITFLLNQIDAIRKFSSKSIFLISSFILMSQYIEFSLRNFIFLLDFVVTQDLKRTKSKIDRKPRKPEIFENKTLRQTINAIKEYDGVITDDFKKDLDSLNKLRNNFIHHLYSSNKTMADLSEDSKKGLKLCDTINQKKNSILNNLYNIDKNSPYANDMRKTDKNER